MTPTRNRSETDDLAARIARARGDRGVEPTEAPDPRGAITGVSRGFRLASEFVAAIVVGALIGIGLDGLFGTGPWMAVAFLLFGFAAGVLNVIRATREMNEAVPADALPLPDDDDE